MAPSDGEPLLQRQERREEPRGAGAAEHPLDEPRQAHPRTARWCVSQLVWTFASLTAFSMYSWSRSISSGAARSAVERARRRRAPGRSDTRRCGRAPARRRRASGAPRFSGIQRETSRPHSSGDLREHVDARAHVLAELRVVRGRRQHLERPVAPPRRVRVVELRDRAAEPRRIAADLVEREQQVVAVERRVLEALGLHRARVLLQLHREAQPLARLVGVGRRVADAALVLRPGRRRLVGDRAAARPRGRSRRATTPSPGCAGARARSPGRRTARSSARPAAARRRRCDRPGKQATTSVSTSRRLSSVKSRDRRLPSAIRLSVCASTFSSLAIAVAMISRLLA